MGLLRSLRRGFFDFENVPPWDTWICYVAGKGVNDARWHPFDAYLLSWVPVSLVDLVTAGIDANPEGCICWARDLDKEFVRQLVGAGLVS